MILPALLTVMLGAPPALSGPGDPEPGHFPRAAACGEPIAWRVGRVAPDSELDRAEFQRKVEAAAKAWNHAGQGTLLVHDPVDGFPVDLRAGEAQQQARDLTRLQAALTGKRERLEDLSFRVEQSLAERGDLEERHNEEVAAYNAAVQEYNRRVQEIGQRVARSERTALEETRQALAAQRTHLQQLETEFTLAGKTASESIREYNELAGTINELLARIQARLPGAPRDAGDYREILRLSATGEILDVQRSIRIHFWYYPQHLKTTLAHEFGHALGLDHVAEPDAVMHASYTAGFEPLAFRLHPADIAALNEHCG